MFFTRVAAALAAGSLFASAAPAYTSDYEAHSQGGGDIEVEVEVEVEVSGVLNELLGVTSSVLPQLSAVTDITEENVLPLVKQLTDAIQAAADGLSGMPGAPAIPYGSYGAGDSGSYGASYGTSPDAGSVVVSATSQVGSVTSSVVGTVTSVVGTATSVVGSSAAVATAGSSSVVARDGQQEVAQLLYTILSDVGRTLDPILGDLQQIPAVNELLVGLSPLLYTVLATVDALLPGVIALVSGLVGPVIDLLKGLGLGHVLALLGL
ncbi:hypothetical protein CYLTODRAFT_492708 [Cylindrobasidium torrendii FP15055 ss-10]|uniref:Uncharacterized protein n=1 Tax=Cylindrobasidium torrendii FP15055 ss-10 TaxID=1314674 RepID=A0A0D7B399_9AGAR|nr:hypothetical protein CYLTODRAFT_492708 [Cylindrobasidium torrendii FP15055 ss-10]